jgi:hypothetical protein
MSSFALTVPRIVGRNVQIRVTRNKSVVWLRYSGHQPCVKILPEHSQPLERRRRFKKSLEV